MYSICEVIMLPMFSKVEEVKKVISLIDDVFGLLFETPRSLEIIDLIPS